MQDSSLSHWTQRRQTQTRFDLLMALNHLLEGTQLYAKAVSDAQQFDNPQLAHFFSDLEETSRQKAQAAKELLERHSRLSGL